MSVRNTLPPSQIKLETVDTELSVCQVDDLREIDTNAPFVFTACTDKEKSVVCPTGAVPARATARDDGWRAFRISGQLDFSLIGILAGITDVLARNGIGIFAVSTFDTDYILVRRDRYEEALSALRDSGYTVADGQSR